ncbi:MAG: thermonuclease family protein [Thermoanaerobaculia bacterium]|nr:thermonuclease family protein [Thermoanaerobaculia bacterium]
MKISSKAAVILLLAAVVLLARGILVDEPSSSTTPAEEIALEPATAEVVRVFDGDSLVVRYDDGRRVEVRIQGIDAPERKQPYAHQSRGNLRRILRGEQIRVMPRGRDRYDRIIAQLVVNDRDVGLQQIEEGFAWHYRRYADEQPSDERDRYAKAEDRARRLGKGLWKDPRPIPPWEYRQH